MPSFLDQKRVTRVLYLAITHPDQCIALSMERRPPICGVKPLTLCTCRNCYPLTRGVMLEHGHNLADWVNEPGEWESSG